VELILSENTGEKSVLDIGTGSGCIPIALARLLPSTSVSACDVSKDALSVARENATKNEVEIHFFQLDILNSEDVAEELQEEYNIIVSNPPYIRFSEKEGMDKNVTEHEPHLALFVKDEDDIVFYKKIIGLSAKYLAPAGRLYFELNPLSAGQVLAFAENSGFLQNCELKKDMSGALRFFKAQKK
jgi:release factor glutamine methyltransferase